MRGQGVREKGSRFENCGLGVRVEGVGFRVQGLGFRVHGVGFEVEGTMGKGLEVWGLG